MLCYTCMESIGLLDEVAVGVVGEMGEIITAMMTAGNAVTLWHPSPMAARVTTKRRLRAYGPLFASGTRMELVAEEGTDRMGQKKWTTGEMPDQTGRLALVTGANSGLGYESALALARRCAHVVMGVRSLEKGRAACERLLKQAPGASLELLELDLASLTSVRAAAAAFNASHPMLDILMNNAGVMATPQRQTAEGFELQFGTNHLGHFALTGLVLDALNAAPAARVVTVYSMAALMGRFPEDKLAGTENYQTWLAYGRSKAANLAFALDLDRRLRASGSPARSIAAHPGFAATNLQTAGPSLGGKNVHARTTSSFQWFAQSAEMGALPQLYAATAPEAEGGACYGPHGACQSRGHPARVRPNNPLALKAGVAGRLWAESEKLTGVYYLTDY